jgi:hypothetical protein
VVDDGSEVDVIKYLESLSLKDSRISFYRREGEQKGAPICRNLGATKAKYDFLWFLDSDDLLGCSAVESRLKVISDNLNYDFYIFPVGIFEDQPHDILQFQNLKDNRDDLDRFCYGENVWQTLGVIWNKIFFQSISGFNVALPSFQDWELSMRSLIASSNYLYTFVNTPDAFYRIDANLSISNNRYNEKNAVANAEMILEIFTRIINQGNLSEYRRVSFLNFYLSRISFWIFIQTDKNRKTQILFYLNLGREKGMILSDEFDFCKKYLLLYVSKLNAFFKKRRANNELNLKNSPFYLKLIERPAFKKYTYTL